MGRFFKKLFSRFTFVALTIILIFLGTVALIGGAIYMSLLLFDHYLPEYTVYLYYALVALAWLSEVVAVLNVVNRDMLPETKLPWILCIVTLNALGVAMYIVFSHNRITRLQQRRYRLLYERMKRFQSRALPKEYLEETLKSRADISEALALATPSAVAYANTKTQYFPSGESFFDALLQDLERAEKYIFLEFFIIAKGEMWSAVLDVLRRKVNAGVEVRVMYDDIGSMSRVHVRYYNTLRKMGIKCVKFNPFVPVVTNVHNFRDHRKIVVVDGKIAYTGGLNLGDEYINKLHLHGHWKDSALRLEGVGVKSLILLFLGMYNMQKRSDEDFAKFIPEYEAFEDEGIVQAYGSGPRPIYERQIGEDVFLNILGSAKNYVYITTPYLIIDYRLREALCLAAQRGVDVRIVTPKIPDKKIVFALTRSNYMALIKAGVKIYEYTPGFIHAKNFLCDDEIGVVGTINLDYRSLMHHYEDAVLMFKTKALKEMKVDFEETFALSELQTKESAKRNVIFRWILEIAKVFAPLF
ncbi:MAG: cardiolipin synthase [Clostridia bacterium]|nr:cardiolipin synthase [Clostridia bacterium]